MTHPAAASPHWSHRVARWAQVNLTEVDATDFDTEKWIRHWKQTHTQGIIVNAGGVVAYYPTEIEHHPKAAHLGDRDLFGEIASAARDSGLVILARMDCSRGIPELYEEHPDWFAQSADGQPFQAKNGRYLTCVNGPYYKQFIPSVLREIGERYQPEGYADNSWSGLGAKTICHCPHCHEKFERDTGLALPAKPDFDDATYRRWFKWSYACRTENWDLFNRVVQEAVGPHCHWIGMVHADPLTGHVNFCDLVEVGKRAPILLSDQQSRVQGLGFEQNSINGKLLQGVSSWQTPITESMALYPRGERTFRLSAASPAESRHWIHEGIAGGIRPWWHLIGARAYEKRRLAIVQPIADWHAQNETYLLDREPIAEVGLLWSHHNIDFYGRDLAAERVGLPWQGWIQTMVRSRIPFLPINTSRLTQLPPGIRTLILPDLAVVTDEETAALAAFVGKGGNLVASGLSGALDSEGLPRSTPALDALFGIQRQGIEGMDTEGQKQNWENSKQHTYLMLPEPADQRHPILQGFEATSILAFGSRPQPVTATESQPIAGYIPNFPIYPPEFSWIRQEEPDTPTLLVRETPSGARLVYLAADIDRCYGKRRLPDHRRLLANAIQWAHQNPQPISISGPGIIDISLYRQNQERLVLHLVNTTNAQSWPDHLEEIIPLHDLAIALRRDLLPKAKNARSTVSPSSLPLQTTDTHLNLTLPKLEAHEMIVIQ